MYRTDSRVALINKQANHVDMTLRRKIKLIARKLSMSILSMTGITIYQVNLKLWLSICSKCVSHHQ